MLVLIGIGLFVLGLIVGSFLNVIVLRFNTGKGIGGRSHCFSCGYYLSWIELVPVLSWLFQRGRCRNCSSIFSRFYVVGELMTGIVFVGLGLRAYFVGGEWMSVNYVLSTLFLFIVSSILIVIFRYDLRHKIIPDSLSLVFGILGLVSIFFLGWEQGVLTLVGFHIPEWSQVLAGIIIPLPFVLLWVISRGVWIGLGDPKLMVGIGFLLGLSRGFSAIMLSFWIGTLCVIALWIVGLIFKKGLLGVRKHSIMKQEIPFAPFLIVALWITIIVNLNFFSL